jgi:hypothetical protein
MATYQFGICFLVFVLRIFGQFMKGKGNTGHTFNMLIISAYITLAAVVLPMISVIVYTFAFERRTINMYYTNQLNVTGGCTFTTGRNGCTLGLLRCFSRASVQIWNGGRWGALMLIRYDFAW